MDIFEVLATAKAKKASDLHLSAGSPPLVRVNGELMQMTEFAFPTPEDLKSMFLEITTMEGIEKFQKDHELDFKYILPDDTSLHCSAAQERGQLIILDFVLKDKCTYFSRTSSAFNTKYLLRKFYFCQLLDD